MTDEPPKQGEPRDFGLHMRVIALVVFVSLTYRFFFSILRWRDFYNHAPIISCQFEAPKHEIWKGEFTPFSQHLLFGFWLTARCYRISFKHVLSFQQGILDDAPNIFVLVFLKKIFKLLVSQKFFVHYTLSVLPSKSSYKYSSNFIMNVDNIIRTL